MIPLLLLFVSSFATADDDAEQAAAEQAFDAVMSGNEVGWRGKGGQYDGDAPSPAAASLPPRGWDDGAGSGARG